MHLLSMFVMCFQKLNFGLGSTNASPSKITLANQIWRSSHHYTTQSSGWPITLTIIGLLGQRFMNRSPLLANKSTDLTSHHPDTPSVQGWGEVFLHGGNAIIHRTTVAILHVYSCAIRSLNSDDGTWSHMEENIALAAFALWFHFWKKFTFFIVVYLLKTPFGSMFTS